MLLGELFSRSGYYLEWSTPTLIGFGGLNVLLSTDNLHVLFGNSSLLQFLKDALDGLRPIHKAKDVILGMPLQQVHAALRFLTVSP